MTTIKETKQSSTGTLTAADRFKSDCEDFTSPSQLSTYLKEQKFSTNANSMLIKRMNDDREEFAHDNVYVISRDTVDSFGRKWNHMSNLYFFSGENVFRGPICTHPLKYVTNISGTCNILALRCNLSNGEKKERFEAFRKEDEFDIIICSACKCAYVEYTVDTSVDEDLDEEDVEQLPIDHVQEARICAFRKDEQSQKFFLDFMKRHTTQDASISPMDTTDAQDKSKNPDL